MHPSGFIHGRFQVVHNDHLAYLLAGKARCAHLIIGITNPDPASTTAENTDPARSDPKNNPLSYAEREKMIHAAMVGAGVDSNDFDIIPFPICKPEQLGAIAPKDAIYYLTIYDDWGRTKKERFESLGLSTEVMWEKTLDRKGLTGTEVRRAIATGGDWRAMVPRGVAALVERWNLQERFAELSNGSSGS